MKIKHADIVAIGECKGCGYPVIKTTTNNNHPMAYQGWDYWQYCTNKGCVNHIGEGYAQQDISWSKFESIGQYPGEKECVKECASIKNGIPLDGNFGYQPTCKSPEKHAIPPGDE